MISPDSVRLTVPVSARAAAIITWVYATGFGLPAIPIAVFVVRQRSLPWFLHLFPVYGGPWSNAGRWTERGLLDSLRSPRGV